MKLLTLNTHSLVEENYEEKLSDFVRAVAKEKPDVIALQEVNQQRCAKAVLDNYGYFASDEGAIVKEDNHILRTVKMLNKLGIEYYWTWLPIKQSYGVYEEGIGLMSLSPILETSIKCVSKQDDYGNWKTRKIIGIRTEKSENEWFFSVHYGWWNDEEEPFLSQWKATMAHLESYDDVWLLGDFNNPAEIRGEGYDEICYDGWKDTYLFAGGSSKEGTVNLNADGWKNKDYPLDSARVDQIWFENKKHIGDYRVIFDGEEYPVVSDHYGVMVEYEKM